MSEMQQRLVEYLHAHDLGDDLTVLTPDASTREYFRIGWTNGTAIACVYPEPFVAAEQSYLDVTNLFRAADLPVPEVYDYDERLGVIVQEDLGDTILRTHLERAAASEREELLRRAIALIARIQAATPLAFERNSIPSKLSFDFEKLSWELDFFTAHYFETLQKKPLGEAAGRALKSELDEVANELAEMAVVLTHRDFHAANLMLSPNGRLRVIDARLRPGRLR